MKIRAALVIVGSLASPVVGAFAGCGGTTQNSGSDASLEAGGSDADEAGAGWDSGGSSSSSGSGSSSSGYDATAPTDAGGIRDSGSLEAGSWMLTWSDEFSLPNGSPPDPNNWNIETGGGGWGNQELEYYTTDLPNAQIQNGNLVITAIATQGNSSYQCAYTTASSGGGTCEYTSARLDSNGLFSQLYGRFEASIRIPAGPGMWPAFWGLGVSGGWPKGGEIDVMENKGIEPSINHGSLHGSYSGPGGYQNVTGIYTLPGGAKLSDAFHLYAIEWEPNVVRFYVDDQLYETQTKAGIAASGDQWPFDQPFYLLLNVAVGGTFGGPPTSSTVFPQQMLVDYVRVYSRVGADY